MDQTLGLIGNIVSILSGIVIVYLSLKRFPLESKATDASALDVLTEASVALIQPMKLRIGELEKEVENLGKSIVDKDARITTLEQKTKRQETQLQFERARLEMFTDWTNRLLDQVRELGEEPVSFDNGNGKKKGTK